jgi:Xaa-Pro aminopeptidase
MMGFETLTHVPIDRNLIDLALLTDEERAWVDAYHVHVQDVVERFVEGDAKAWLRAACAPL